MNWIVWLLGATIGTSLERCLNRLLLRDNPGYWEYLLGYNLGALAFIIPIHLGQFSLGASSTALSLLVLSGFCWFLCCLFGFIADTSTSVSITGILSQMQLIFIFLGGVCFLGESFTLVKLGGTLLIIAGLTLLVPKVRFSWNSGVFFKIAGTFFGAVALLMDKRLLETFHPSIISITGYSIPLLLVIVFRPKVVFSTFKESRKIHFLNVGMGVLGCATYNMLLHSFKTAPITLVYPIYQLNLVLTLIIGFLVLKEREHLWQKVLCTLLVILGSVVIQ